MAAQDAYLGDSGQIPVVTAVDAADLLYLFRDGFSDETASAAITGQDLADGLAALSGGGGGGGGGGGPTGFVTIGPVGSGADFECDGTLDNVETQAALDSIGTSGTNTGGTVKVLPNFASYNFGTHVINLHSDIVFLGSGWNSTRFFLNNNVNLELFVHGNAALALDRISFMDFGMDGNRANQNVQPTGSDTWQLLRIRSDAQNSYGGVISSVYSKNARQNGISIESHYFLTVRDCFSELATGQAIWNENGGDMNIVNNYTRESGAGIKILSSHDVTITGNVSKSDNNSSFAGQQIQDCAFINNMCERSGWHGLTFTVSTGINLSGALNCTLVGNTIYGTYGHGIQINGSDNNVFSSMTFRRNGLGTTNTYSDILFTDAGGGTASNDNQFTGMVFQNDSPAYYSERVKSNIEAASTTNHNANIFNQCKFDVVNVPLTGYLVNFQKNNVGVTGNTVVNSIGINPDTYYYHGSKTANFTVTRAQGLHQEFTMGANLTLTITNGIVVGDEMTLKITQDATGSRVITWPANFKKAGGALVLSTAASSIDIVRMRWDGTNWIETSRSLALA